MRRDHHDIWGGGALAVLGLGVAGYALARYDFGTLRQMGPGFFPTVLGLILAGLGLAVAVPAWWRQGEARPFEWPEVAAVLAAILFFAFTLNGLGLIVATAGTVLIGSIPAPRGGLVWRLVLAVLVTVLTWAIFKLGLAMTIPLWPWSR